MSPDKACQIILACAVLHNICKLRQIPLPGNEEEDENNGGDQQGDGVIAPDANVEGVRYRQQFAETHF